MSLISDLEDLSSTKVKLEAGLKGLEGLESKICNDIQIEIEKINKQIGAMQDGLFVLSLAQDDYQPKLSEMLSVDSFNSALIAAMELDLNLQIPYDAYSKIMAELKQLSPEEIDAICEEMQKPTLIIVPANEFHEKIKQLNENKHYEDQNNTSVSGNLYNVPVGKTGKINKTKVRIVEGIPHPKQHEGSPITLCTLGLRKEYEIERLNKKNMDLIDPHSYITLLQKSLIEVENTGDNCEIVDYCDTKTGTATILNFENSKTKDVTCGYFYSYFHRAYFRSNMPSFENDYIRGRALVEVLEF
jgi:hypothetical protein